MSNRCTHCGFGAPYHGMSCPVALKAAARNTTTKKVGFRHVQRRHQPPKPVACCPDCGGRKKTDAEIKAEAMAFVRKCERRNAQRKAQAKAEAEAVIRQYEERNAKRLGMTVESYRRLLKQRRRQQLEEQELAKFAPPDTWGFRKRKKSRDLSKAPDPWGFKKRSASDDFNPQPPDTWGLRKKREENNR